MKNDTERSYRGVGFTGLLCLLFIGLKLSGHISWSWIWVLSPLWIGFSLKILVILLACLFVSSKKIM